MSRSFPEHPDYNYRVVRQFNMLSPTAFILISMNFVFAHDLKR